MIFVMEFDFLTVLFLKS